MDNKDLMWAMQPRETSLSFKVFQRYLHMLDDPKAKRRSLHRLAKEMGYSDEKALENWSATNNWVERARAYDSWHAVAIVQREINDLGAFQVHVVESLTEQLAAMNVAINTTIKALLSSNEAASGTELKRVIEAIKLKDDLMRRVAKLPTTYLSENEEKTDVQMEYIIGGE